VVLGKPRIWEIIKIFLKKILLLDCKKHPEGAAAVKNL
jgi:hypothetical protein